MWIILGVLFSLPALALEPFEKLTNVKVLRVLPDNIVLVNRGVEDGIERNDHAKFSTDLTGYSARAIAVKVGMETSYWRLYRIPHSEAFSLDYTYTITGMADREIPFPVAHIRDEIEEINDPEERRRADTKADPFDVRSDLPEQLTERDILEAEGPERRKLFVEEALDRDRLSRDLEDFDFSVFASPFIKESLNDAEILRYGIEGGNVGSRYRLFTQFEQHQFQLKDPISDQTVSTRRTFAQLQFVILSLSPSISSLSLIHYNSQTFNSLGTPEDHWLIGPLGFTWHLYESKTWEFVNLSYIPLYDLRNTEFISRDGSIKELQTNGLRHGFRFGLKARMSERVALENLLWVRPYQELATWDIEEDDLNLINDTKIIFNLTENLFLDYNFIYRRDKVWAVVNNLPESNTINSVNFRYDFDL